MALPSNWTRVTVQGKFLNLDGTPMTGAVTFTPTASVLLDAGAATVIAGTKWSVTLDGTGFFTVQLPATDDPDINPTGLTDVDNVSSFSYTVVEPTGRRYTLAVPSTSGMIDLVTVGSPAGSSTAPGAPTIGTATAGSAGSGQVSVAFTAPTSDGGATITGYTATSTPGDVTGTGSSSPITVSGLTPGTAYTFTVKATNSVGTGAESDSSNSVTPPAAGPATLWTNRTAGLALANGTASHTITFSTDGDGPFTPTNGRMLLIIMAGAVTMTWPGGWTERLQPTGNTELSVATISASSTTSVTVTHNASNYPVRYVVYEFAVGATWVGETSGSAMGTTVAQPTLTGLPGTPVTVFYGLSQSIGAASGAPMSATWTVTEDVDVFTDGVGAVDGVWLGVAYADNVTSTSSTTTPTLSNARTSDTERVTFAIDLPDPLGLGLAPLGTSPLGS